MDAHHNLHKLIGSVYHLTRPEAHGCLPSSHAKNLHTKRFLWEMENDSGLIESKIEPKYESRRARIAIGRGRSLTGADGSPTPLDRGWGAAGGQRIRRERGRGRGRRRVRRRKEMPPAGQMRANSGWWLTTGPDAAEVGDGKICAVQNQLTSRISQLAIC